VSLSNDFYEHTLPSIPVELAVEDLLPWSEVHFAVGDSDHHFTARDLPLEMRVCIVLAGSVVVILRSGSMRGEFSSQTS
jgi:hypothetical protein